jgi:hypothetical protein
VGAERASAIALVRLPSGERILISIGSATARVLDKSTIFAWCFTKTVVSERLDTWQPEYWQCNRFYRRINRAMILDGLLALLSNYHSIDEVRRAWPTLQNPIDVIGRKIFDVPQHKE